MVPDRLTLRLLGRTSRESGAAIIITVILMSVVLIGLTSLVVELGLARDTRRQAQNAADAAVLAAGNSLASGGSIATAVAAAKNLAARNYGTTATNWASCTDSAKLTYSVAGDTPCISFNSSSAPTQVRVLVPFRPVVTPLAGIFGNQSVNVQAVAVVGLTGSSLGPCGICVIGTGPHDLQNGEIDVSGGASVIFNGTLDSGPHGTVNVTGGGTITLDGPAPSKASFTPTPAVNQPPIVDPLAALTLPDYSSLTAKTGNACSAGPGIYGSLNIPNNAVCTMPPGLYVIYGQNHLSSKVNLTALGVTLYFVCATGTTIHPCAVNETGGDLLMTGQATLRLTAPTTGPTAGLAAVSDRNNTAVIGWRGNGTQQNTGTVYFKSGTFDYRGNGAGSFDDSHIVVGDLSFSGNGTAIQAVYTQANNVVVTAPSMGLTQ